MQLRGQSGTFTLTENTGLRDFKGCLWIIWVVMVCFCMGWSAAKDLDISSFSFPFCVRNILSISPTSLRSIILLLWYLFILSRVEDRVQCTRRHVRDGDSGLMCLSRNRLKYCHSYTGPEPNEQPRPRSESWEIAGCRSSVKNVFPARLCKTA